MQVLCRKIEVDSACLQDDDIPGIVRYRTYEVLKDEVANPKLRWAYLPYSMHMAGPREAIQHMIIRKNFGETHSIDIFSLTLAPVGIKLVNPYRKFVPEKGIHGLLKTCVH